ncbi:hypothetical protein AAG906_035505 [Vitis piasezkii]
MQGKNKEKQGEEENRGQQLQSSLALLEHFPKSIFTRYIPFQSSGSQESNASNCVRFGAETRNIWPSEDNCSRFYHRNDFELPIFVASNGAAEGATNIVKQPLRVTCDLHHKFEMEIPHEDQSSHYDHEKDKFAYLSMRDRIELGKRQVQQSQWGSKYTLNGDDSYEHTVRECPTIPTVRDMYGYQSSYTSSWNNHPNLTTLPQPQPSMSTSSLEQAILKISKVMED